LCHQPTVPSAAIATPPPSPSSDVSFASVLRSASSGPSAGIACMIEAALVSRAIDSPSPDSATAPIALSA
jgi:hypothetical protein